MRIEEIIVVSTGMPSVNVTDSEVNFMRTFFDEGSARLKLPHQLEARERTAMGYRWIGMFKAGKLAGWVKLRPTQMKRQEVHIVDLVYLLPEFRRTIVAGWIFLYAKDLIGTPIVLGDDTTYGGAVFKDGEDLITALSRTGKFELSLINMKTGEKEPLELPLKDHRFTTVMIESLVDLPFTQRLAEAHAVGELHSSYHEELDWLGDDEPAV